MVGQAIITQLQVLSHVQLDILLRRFLVLQVLIMLSTFVHDKSQIQQLHFRHSILILVVCGELEAHSPDMFVM
jgi:hypothetical protein